MRLLDATVTVRLLLMVTAPVPRLRSLLPAKVKSPLQFCALLVESVMAPPLVLPIVPPEIVKAPLPRAEALLRLSCPAESVVPPLYVSEPPRASVPVPVFVRAIAPVVFWMAPENVPLALPLPTVSVYVLDPERLLMVPAPESAPTPRL